MLAAGASECDREVALPFFDIMREQVEHKVEDAGEELAGLGKAADIRGYLGVEAGLLAEFRNEVGVGQEADVEDHIGVEGHAVFEAEAEAGDE